jgi:arylsulfatase A-like enzyme
MGIRRMKNPYEEFSPKMKDRENQFRDPSRIQNFMQIISHADRPYFAHLHLSGPHGPWFRVDRRHFSVGKKMRKKWMTDYYDDSILTCDKYLERIVTYLKHKGRLRNTILVIYSDHGKNHNASQRVPLLFIFPNSTGARKIDVNVQLIDIAPTLLDYLNISVPEWMEGRSIFSLTKKERLRPIFATYSNNFDEEARHQALSETQFRPKPPLYGMTEITMTECQFNYRYDPNLDKLTSRIIKDHTHPCRDEERLTDEFAREKIRRHLQENNGEY